MSDVELRDELITLLEAGHETTATGLAWVFERLIRHPRELGSLQEELAVGQTEYLRAVIRERLRVRPVDPRSEAGRLHHVTIVPARQALLSAEPRPG